MARACCSFMPKSTRDARVQKSILGLGRRGMPSQTHFLPFSFTRIATLLSLSCLPYCAGDETGASCFFSQYGNQWSCMYCSRTVTPCIVHAVDPLPPPTPKSNSRTIVERHLRLTMGRRSPRMRECRNSPLHW